MERIRAFLKNNKLSNASVFVVRSDGLLIYSDLEKEDFALGALISGLSSAACAISNLLNIDDNNSLRLSFDTSSDGIYILFFSYNDFNFSLCAIFKDELNPALIKNNLRKLNDRLCEDLTTINKIHNPENIGTNLNKNDILAKQNDDLKNTMKKSKERKNYLFSDISDGEMDALFGGVGGKK